MRLLPCDRVGCTLPATIHHNGEHFCSPACQLIAEEQERRLRREARGRLAQARDRRGELSTSLAGALAVLALSYCLLGGYQPEAGGANHWKGEKLVARGDAPWK